MSKWRKFLSIEYLILGVLVLIAVVLSVAIYKKVTPRNPSENQAVAPSDVALSPTQPATEQDVLKTPGPNATTEQRNQYYQLVVRFAKAADTMDVTGCAAKPLALKTLIGQGISVTNNDAIEHKIVFDRDNHFTIPANSQQPISVSFTNGPGIYGYGCDGSPSAVGLVLATSK